MPDIPPELQRKMLGKWVAKLFRDLNLDPVLGLEALDVTFDTTLQYSENRKLLEEELGRRGVFAQGPTPESPEWKKLEELPEYKPDVELRKELEEMKAEREQYRREAERLKERLQRREQLSEAEQLRLAEEMRELEKKLQMMLSGIPDTYIKELKEIFLKLPGADEDTFWKFFALHRDEIKEKHGTVVAASFEGSMKEFMVGKPPMEKALPAEVVIFKPPESKFKIGDRVFHEQFREVTVRQALWDKDYRRWIYVVEKKSGRLERVPEAELIELPPLPVGVVPVPGAPPRAPRVPRAALPPKTVEELIADFEKQTGAKLTRLASIPVYRTEAEQVPKTYWEMTDLEKRQEEAGLVPVKTVMKFVVEHVSIPPGMFIFYDKERADKVIKDVEAEIWRLKRDELEFKLPPPIREQIERLRATAVEKFQFYEVDQKVAPITYSQVISIVRRAMRPVIPARARREPTPLEMHYQTMASVEANPAFRKYVEEEVGLTWEAYLTSDGWSKDALRRAFSEKLLKGGD